MRGRLASLLFAVLLVGCSDDAAKPDATVKKDGAPDVGKIDKGKLGDLPLGKEAGKDKAVTKDLPAAKLVIDYVPKDNDVAGWTADATACKADSECTVSKKCDTNGKCCSAFEAGKVPAGTCSGLQFGYTKLDIEAIIDGSHDPYGAAGCNGFALQNYKNGTFKLKLYLWDMKDATGAKAMFDKNKKDAETSSGLVFETIAGVLDAGIIANDNPDWKVYGYKGHYVFKIYATFPDPKDAATLKPEAVSFTKFITSKLP